MTERSIHEFADKQGSNRRIVHSSGALDSWEKVVAKLNHRKAALIEGQLIAVFDDWINGSRFHSGWADPEGNITRTTKFFAIKRIPVRVYFWYSTNYRNTIVISHYVKKTWRKLRNEDVKRIKANWKRENAGNQE